MNAVRFLNGNFLFKGVIGIRRQEYATEEREINFLFVGV